MWHLRPPLRLACCINVQGGGAVIIILISFPTRLSVSARVEKKAVSLYVVMQLTVCVKAIP